MLDENTDKLLRNTSMAKKKEVHALFVVALVTGVMDVIGVISVIGVIFVVVGTSHLI